MRSMSLYYLPKPGGAVNCAYPSGDETDPMKIIEEWTSRATTLAAPIFEKAFRDGVYKENPAGVYPLVIGLVIDGEIAHERWKGCLDELEVGWRPEKTPRRRTGVR